MRIGRILTREGQTLYVEVLENGRFHRLHGDPFSDKQLAQSDEEVSGLLLAPVVPPAIYCIGLNYLKHAEETGKELPKHPVVFMKPPSAVQHPGGPIRLPRGLRSDKVDYECELAAVVGRRCRHVPVENALDCLLGYTCANDVSARDWQGLKGGGQWCLAKSFDTFCPLGPWITTTDEIPDPQQLRLRTIVSGETRQDWTTSDMIFRVAEIVSFLSHCATLEPGTVILTGTPHGVGMASEPPRWLLPGDSVRIEIDRIGSLDNPVVEEKPHAPPSTTAQ